jgi:hypothetical protein
MVPLEKVLKKPAPRSEPLFVPPKRRPREPAPLAPRAPHRFRIVDVATRAVLADDVGARAALETLGDVRSSVDVHVFIRDGDDWQLLSLAEQRLMWERRSRAHA